MIATEDPATNSLTNTYIKLFFGSLRGGRIAVANELADQIRVSLVNSKTFHFSGILSKACSTKFDSMSQLFCTQNGKVIPKRGLTRFTENGAVFEDGSEIHDIDLVILATGFDMNLDFIDVAGIKGKLQRIANMISYDRFLIYIKCIKCLIKIDRF